MARFIGTMRWAEGLGFRFFGVKGLEFRGLGFGFAEECLGIRHKPETLSSRR